MIALNRNVLGVGTIGRNGVDLQEKNEANDLKRSNMWKMTGVITKLNVLKYCTSGSEWGEWELSTLHGQSFQAREFPWAGSLSFSRFQGVAPGGRFMRRPSA